jgi:hypothetical protein
MGYYTRYELTWKVPNGETISLCTHKKPAGAKFCPQCGEGVKTISTDEAIIQKLSKIIEESDSGEMHGINCDGSTAGNCKWYEHEQEVAEFSKYFPTTLFTLNGEGEETGDIWKKYFLNGKMQVAKAKILFDEFDEKKLKKV